MQGKWAWSLAGVLAMLVMGSGCVSLDKYQALERSHRLLQEKLSEVQDDLQNSELHNQQLNTQIAALKDQLGTKDQTIASLQAENESLRANLAKAQEILEKQAGKLGNTTIINQGPLPSDVSSALEQLAKEYPDLLEFDKAKGAVRWKADLLFPLGSDQLTASPEVMEAMKKFAQIVNMPSAANLDVIVVGHTCNTPIKKAETLARFKDNWYLSAGRAIVVMQMFNKEGVGFPRLGVMGYGEYRPIADNSTKEGKAKNRRVEVYLVQKGSVQSMSGQSGLYQVKDSNLMFAKAGEKAKEPSEAKPTVEESAAPKN